MPGFTDEGATVTVASGRGVNTPAISNPEVPEELDSTDIKNRDIRQRGILPSEKLQKIEVVIAGVGAVGHQVARSLASTGVGKITIWDPDTVGTENLAPQGFTEAQVGKSKVNAVMEEMKALNSSILIEGYPSRLRNSWMDSLPNAKAKDEIRRILFVCVDNMDSRKAFYDTHRFKFHGIIDTRMNAEVMRVIGYDPASSDYDYSKALFREEDAIQGTCTTRSLNYTSMILAGFAMHRFSQLVRDHKIHNDYLLDLNAAAYKDMLEPSGFTEE